MFKVNNKVNFEHISLSYNASFVNFDMGQLY